jgi:hypothetical protein
MDQADFNCITGWNVCKFCYSILCDSCTMIGTEVLSSVFDTIFIVRFEILTTLNIDNALFWDVTPWSLVFTNVSVYLPSPYSQFTETMCSSESLANIDSTTWRHVS